MGDSQLYRSRGALAILSCHVLGQCGVERWPVKTGTDTDARLVDFDHECTRVVGSAPRYIATPPRSSMM